MRILLTPILLVGALAAGCASIPLSTALRLSSMDPESLTRVDPADVRVQVSLPTGFEPDVEAARLNLTLGTPGGEVRTAAMGLSLLQRAQEHRSPGWLRSDVPVSTYVLALSSDGIEQLRDVQGFVLSNHSYELSFKVSAPLSKTPPDAKEMTFWVDLKLFREEPFMRLIDAAKIEFERPESDG